VRERSRRARFLAACAIGAQAFAAMRAAGIREPVRLAEVAAEHGVVPALDGMVQQLGPAADNLAGIRPDLVAAGMVNRTSHRRLTGDLASVADVLDGLDWLLVKGPAVAHSLYEVPTWRSAGDLDVVVSPAQFATAVERFEQSGHRVLDRNWQFIRRVRSGQLHLGMRSGTLVDLHWHLLFTDEERQRFPIVTDELLERRRPLSIEGTELHTLDPADTLIHLGLHAAREGGDRLSWLADVHRAVVVGQPDWDDVVARMRAWRVGLPVGTMLLRSATTLDTPVPEGVVDEFVPLPWRALMAAVDRASPAGGSGREVGGLGSLLAKSTTEGMTATASARVATAGLTSRAWLLVRHRQMARIDPVRGDDDPDGLDFASGGPDVRAGYLSDVTAFGI
jgi:hypothetical protein